MKVYRSKSTDFQQMRVLSGSSYLLVLLIFCGLWDAGIKSAKAHMKRVIGNRLLTFEESEAVKCRFTQPQDSSAGRILQSCAVL
jgi:hypothetical protein